MNLSKIKNLTGSLNEFTPEHLLLNNLTLLAFISSIIASFFNLFLKLGATLIIFTILLSLAFIFLFWLTRYKKNFLLTKLIITGLAIIIFTYLWWFNAGSYGPTLLIYLFFYSLIIFIWDGWQRILIISIVSIQLVVFFLFELNNPSHFIDFYPNENSRLLDFYSGLFIYIIMGSLLMIGIKKNYILEKENAKRSNMLKSAFLANLSHEIRTPLNSIMGFSQLLNDDLSKEDKKKYTDIINGNGSYLLNLIDDIIDISKIDAGQIRCNSETLDLKKILTEIKSVLSQELIKQNKENLELIFDTKHKNIYVHADKVRLKQVLLNIIDNAIKYTEKGSIIVKVQQKDNSIITSVKDTGTGIKPEFQKIIFERFIKTEHFDPTKLQRGMGLGLSITRQLVEKMGGNIWVRSEYGKGSTFFFTLPAAKKITKSKKQIKKMDAKRLDWKNKTILVAEDVESSYLLVKHLLNKKSAKIIWARDGKEAVTLAENNPGIDLILMDIRMPKMNGYTATKKIKEKNPDIPVIALTAHALKGDKETSIAHGCDAYISKPINIENLLELIEQFLLD